ncbi:MAG: dihydroorotate dehydrogenase electron transfer subunit [Eubacterium sp.]|nr:dihydroorotate dehydrogenase electron transfer subunit [Eubacterium sp.]
MKTAAICEVIRQKELIPGIFDLLLKAPEIAAAAVPGQFVNVYTNDASKLLPRPISICEADSDHGTLRLVYRVSGEKTGTRQFAALQTGSEIRILGPLGNGFPVDEIAGKHIFLCGGGIGIPPMLETAKAAKKAGAEIDVILGYRDQCFLADEFAAYGTIHIATEDGSTGVKGTILDAILQEQLQADVILACGPKPMLRALKAYTDAKQVPCWISMEERMACGIGACLACVCETKDKDAHSHVRNARVCKDGPVFRTTEVVL